MSNEDLIVFGAGFGRTGTMSLKVALDTLGVGPCHHMVEVLKHGQLNKWIEIEHSAQSQKEKDAILKSCLSGSGFRSACDFPSSSYFEDLLRLYPKAKVILTIRDTPQQWINSVKDTIFAEKFGNGNKFSVSSFPLKQLAAGIPFVPPLGRFHLMEKGFNKIWLDKPIDWTEQSVVAMYNDWIKHVQKTVPSGQLLIFNVKQGWEPLCQFLNLPVPETPMPRVNDKKEFQDRIQSINTKLTLLIIVWYTGLGYGIFRAQKAGLFETLLTRVKSFIFQRT